jgi:hypothetical protein
MATTASWLNQQQFYFLSVDLPPPPPTMMMMATAATNCIKYLCTVHRKKRRGTLDSE